MDGLRATLTVLAVSMVVVVGCGDDSDEPASDAAQGEVSQPAGDEPRPLPPPARSTDAEFLEDRGLVRIWPDSARVDQGVLYGITVGTHCGLGPLDFDGSFWEVVSGPTEPDGQLADPEDRGVIRLESAERAVYVTSTGAEVVLSRIGDEPLEVDICE